MPMRDVRRCSAKSLEYGISRRSIWLGAAGYVGRGNPIVGKMYPKEQ
jgi:hypothetical protein